mmetsp:Transcript_44854/g.116156  ORF Transcript_44854/g.116156 Transcript_44854/m.116156 type:complete len:707 (-) Transcript_44854:162-2282(-)
MNQGSLASAQLPDAEQCIRQEDAPEAEVGTTDIAAEGAMEVESVTGSEGAGNVDPSLCVIPRGPRWSTPHATCPARPQSACASLWSASRQPGGSLPGTAGSWSSDRATAGLSATGPASLAREQHDLSQLDEEAAWRQDSEGSLDSPRPQTLGHACSHCALAHISHPKRASAPRPTSSNTRQPVFGLGDPVEVHSLPDLRTWAPRQQRQPPSRPVSRESIAAELRASAQRLLQRLRGSEGECSPAGEDAVGPSRLLSAFQGAAAEEQSATFLCLVCFENQRADKRLRLSECTAEGHGCCLECAASFFRSRILQGRVFELPCPVGAADGCCFAQPSSEDEEDSVEAAQGREGAAIALQDEVEGCISDDADLLERYRRFLKTKVDPSLRECPDCQHLCSPSLDAESRPEPAMQCDECDSAFCYYHAAAHRGGSCEEYEVRLAAETKGISDSFGTKDCPRCKRQTLKSGGCNHMTCQVCRAEWCWICSSQLTQRGPHGEGAVYWHYSEENVESGCQQFADAGAHPDLEQVRLRRRDRTPGPFMRRVSMPVGMLSVILLAISAILALAFWLVLYFLSCLIAGVARLVARGAYRAARTEPPEGLGEVGAQRLVKSTLYAAVVFGMFAFLVPFLALTVIWDALAAVLWTCLVGLGRTPVIRRLVPVTSRHHLRFLASAPIRAVHRFGSTILATLADGRGGRVGVFDEQDQFAA